LVYLLGGDDEFAAVLLLLLSCLPISILYILRLRTHCECHQAMQLDAACLGNHDLDLGLAEFSILRDKCTFPWICSNVKHKGTMEPLGGCKEYVVVESKNGKAKFLVLGLVEADWIDTLSTIEPDDVSFEYFTEYIKRRVPEVCSLVVFLIVLVYLWSVVRNNRLNF